MSLDIPYSVYGKIALGFAEQEERVGARELGGNDAGEFVTKYLNANHTGRITHRNEPWCAAFFCWCWVEASRATGKDLVVKYTRGVDELWRRMEQFGRVQKIADVMDVAQQSGLDKPIEPGPFLCEPGDAAFWDWNGDGDPDHVNMVHHVGPDNVLYTIGGNEGTAATGAPVATKRRGRLGDIPKLYGFGRMYREDMIR